MKKIIFNIATLAVSSLLMVSCNDSFLDRNPTHDLNDNSYWNTETDLEVYNNGIYNEASVVAMPIISGKTCRAITMCRKVTRIILVILGLRQARKLFLTILLLVDGTGHCYVA